MRGCMLVVALVAVGCDDKAARGEIERLRIEINRCSIDKARLEAERRTFDAARGAEQQQFRAVGEAMCAFPRSFGFSVEPWAYFAPGGHFACSDKVTRNRDENQSNEVVFWVQGVRGDSPEVEYVNIDMTVYGNFQEGDPGKLYVDTLAAWFNRFDPTETAAGLKLVGDPGQEIDRSARFNFGFGWFRHHFSRTRGGTADSYQLQLRIEPGGIQVSK